MENQICQGLVNIPVGTHQRNIPIPAAPFHKAADLMGSIHAFLPGCFAAAGLQHISRRAPGNAALEQLFPDTGQGGFRCPNPFDPHLHTGPAGTLDQFPGSLPRLLKGKLGRFWLVAV